MSALSQGRAGSVPGRAGQAVLKVPRCIRIQPRSQGKHRTLSASPSLCDLNNAQHLWGGTEERGSRALVGQCRLPWLRGDQTPDLDRASSQK